MRVKLEDVCERGSSNIKQSDIIKMSGNYSIYGASGLAGKVNFYHQEQPYVAVVKDGAGIGRTTLNPAKSSVIGTMQYLIPKKNVLPEYLFYAVSYMHLEKYYTGATIPHIYFKDYKNEEFNLDNIEKQLEIIDVLGRCKKVIEARKQELVELDSLTKARFVEMFGDPVSNPYGYDKVALSDLADIKIGPFGSLLHKEDYIDGGHPLLNPSHIVDGKVSPDDKLTISDEKYEELSAYQLKTGDVVMGRRGEMGRCAVVPEDGFLCGTGSMLIRTKGEVTADYIQKIISFPSFKKTIEDMAVGQTMPNLNVPIVSGFQIIKPPMEVQDRYYAFAEQVNKSKFDTMTFAPIYAIINLYLHTYFYQGRR
ncbi:restriction endonuclease subunit S [Agathobacter rectalis]|uniref:restriction endonuclease subunit S n=1 Tax=Agathobacter rectalis TaxID=39491 RepID=UPI0015713B25|nr:restriction endonuclease subunit S [Agathobacter rectalis]NSJ05613.1 restriction endonuclease subunit S [Agathobacter rectalis]